MSRRTGQFIFGWRGQSKAAGIEPERFYYEGRFETQDFLDGKGQVREPNVISARLASRRFALVKTAHDHRELLLLATKGESHGTASSRCEKINAIHSFAKRSRICSH